MDIAEATKALEPQRPEFALRYYRWALQDARRELAQNFATIRAIPNLKTRWFLQFAQNLSAADVATFCEALVRRAHAKAAQFLGEPPSGRESALLDRFLHQPRDSHPRQLAPAAGAISKAQLRKLLRAALAPHLGAADNARAAEWSYAFPCGSWTIRTNLDTGGSRQFGYWHTIEAHEQVLLADQISFLGWLGLSSTDWRYLTEPEVPPAVDALVALCRRFLGAAPELLAGLTHDLPVPKVRAWREVVTVSRSFANGYTEVIVESLRRGQPNAALAKWKIPTAIIPPSLRTSGARFVTLQDPEFRNPSADPIVDTPAFRHLRVEALPPD
jgi:hypothetical protein